MRNPAQKVDEAAEILELAGSAMLSYGKGNTDQRRRLVRRMTSNRHLSGKELSVELSFPFTVIANSVCVQSGDPYRNTTRTSKAVNSKRLDSMIDKIIRWVKVQETAANGRPGEIGFRPS